MTPKPSKPSTGSRLADRRITRKAYSPTHEADPVGAILAANITRLMERWQIMSDPEIARQSGLDQKTVWRIRHEVMSPSIRTVEAIAVVFGLHAWQLLQPGLDPDNPPHPMRRTSDRKRLAN